MVERSDLSRHQGLPDGAEREAEREPLSFMQLPWMYTPSGAMQLSVCPRPKGPNNYLKWKENFLTLALTFHLNQYFIDDVLRPKPTQVTVENELSAQLAQEKWKNAESKARLLLCNNITTPAAMVILHCVTLKESFDSCN